MDLFSLTSPFDFVIFKRHIMEKDSLIQLTKNLYRLTLFFPKKEPLRYKMRETADDILAKADKGDLEILNSFFEVAKSQDWVSLSDVLAIQKEYDSLRQEVSQAKEVIVEEKEEENPGDNPGQVMPLPLKPAEERQEKIISFLRENGRVQVWQVKEVFPDVTKRTLRRDFEQMLRKGVIERTGERNDTFYQIKTLQS